MNPDARMEYSLVSLILERKSMTTGLTIHNVNSVYISDVEGDNGTHWRTIEIFDMEGHKTEIVLFLPNEYDRLDLNIEGDNGLVNG